MATIRARSAPARSNFELSAAAPYRLDLTVSVLRRLSSNVVDVLTSSGDYVRALSGSRNPVIVRASQVTPKALRVTLEGDGRDHRQSLAIVQRILGIDRDVSHFNRRASRIPWLKSLANRMRGVRPPRYPSLWEACVNAVVFQQVSLAAASAIMRRLIAALGSSLESDGIPLYTFPTAERVAGVEDGVMREAGLSLAKLATLRRIGGALASGTLTESMLEERPSPAAAALLRGIKGIGPWTATLILLRGLGRLDVFPANDTSVTRNLSMISGSASIDIAGVLDALSPQQGMLYYHLLLARLEARGEVGRASAQAAGPDGTNA